MLDVKQAFTIVFKDKFFKEKLLTGSLISIFTALLSVYSMFISRTQLATFKFAGASAASQNTLQTNLISVLSLIITFLLCGYYYSYMHNRILDAEEILPSWKKVLKLLLNGFKYYVNVYVLSIIFILLVLLIAVITAVLFYVFKSSDMLPISFIALVVGILVSIVLAVFYLFLATVQGLVFSEDFKFSSFYNFKKGLKTLNRGFLSFIGIMSLLFIYMAVYMGLVINSLKFGPYAYLLVFIQSLPAFYISMVWADILAQWYNKYLPSENP